MPDRAAFFALQQEAVSLLVGGTILIIGALIRDHLVHAPLLGQPLQLPVHGGQSHPAAFCVQLLRQLCRGGAPLRAVGDACQHGLLLARHIGCRHICHLCII